MKIKFACSLYDRMLPLYTGEVKPKGLDFEFVHINWSREIFDRMAGRQEFEAGEFSSSEFVARESANQNPFVALPVFPSRMFRHGFVWINTRSGIRSPKDLAGKRIGVPVYTMTAAIWIRGHLMHDYGVDFSAVRWVQGSINSPGSHGDPHVLPPLEPVNVVTNETGRSLSDLLSDGEIDAIIGTQLPDSRKRNPDVRRLFPDYKKVEQDYYRRTGVFPIMHLVAIRRDAYQRDPSMAKSLYDAFEASKQLALERMKHLGALRYMLPWMQEELDEIDEVFGDDPWPYGVEANRPTLETLVQYLAEQHIIESPIEVERLFVPV